LIESLFAFKNFLHFALQFFKSVDIGYFDLKKLILIPSLYRFVCKHAFAKLTIRKPVLISYMVQTTSTHKKWTIAEQKILIIGRSWSAASAFYYQPTRAGVSGN